MKWYWYVSQPHEIFCDLDSDRLVWIARRKLDRNIESGHLAVRDAFVYRSSPTPGHYHMIVRLTGISRPMSPLARATWALHLGSDLRRGQYILMRIDGFAEKATIEAVAALMSGAADFLITPKPYRFRKPDGVCDCEAKHKEFQVTSTCPMMAKLLGNAASAEYFARRPKERIDMGKQILGWIKEVPNE